MNEDVLWNKKIVDLDTPVGLLWAVSFIMGKIIAYGEAWSKGIWKSINSQEKQLWWKVNASDAAPTGKNRQGGINLLSMQNKVVQQYENESNL